MSDFIHSSFKETSPFAGSERTQERFNRESGEASATRYFVGNWADRLDFVFDYLFSPVTDAEGITTFVKPNEYPDIKGIYVNDVDIVGEGTPGYDPVEKKSTWARARITVNYSRSFSQGDGSDLDEDNFKDFVYVSESIDSNLELLTISRHELTDVAGNLLNKEHDHALPIPMATIILNKNGVLVPPWGFAGFLLGRVNSSTFITPSGFVCPPNTLRFDGPSGDTKVNIFDGGGLLNEDAFPLPVWDFSLKFEYNVRGWNKVFHEGEWIEVRVAGNRLFAEGNFWPLVFGRSPNEDFNFNLGLIGDAAGRIQASLDLGLDFENPLIQADINIIKASKQALGFRL